MRKLPKKDDFQVFQISRQYQNRIRREKNAGTSGALTGIGGL
jgi:hypothetical protein